MLLLVRCYLLRESICSAHAPPTIEIVANVAKSGWCADWVKIDRIYPNRDIPYHTTTLVRAGGLGITSDDFNRAVCRSIAHPPIPTPIDRDSLSIIIDRSQGKQGINLGGG
jgi:hypothetical protein